MPHEYEIDRRYPWVGSAVSSTPVPKLTRVCVWSASETVACGLAKDFLWSNSGITHFMVLEYPPEKHTAWVNIYSTVRNHLTKEEADTFASASDRPRSACIKIEWTEGDGL